MREKNVLQNNVTVCLLALTSCLLWGSASPCIKTGYAWLAIAPSDVGAQLLFAGVRFALAGVLTVVVGSLLFRKALIPAKQNIPFVFALALVQTVVQYFFYYVALSHTTGVRAAIIQGANAFIALFVAALVFHMERLTAKKVIGSAIGFVGVIVMNLSGGSFGSGFSLFGEGFVLLSAVAYAFSSVMIKIFSQHEHPFTLSGWQLFLGGLVLCAVGFCLGGRFSFTWPGAGLILYLAFLSAAAYSIWGLLLKYNAVASVTVYSFAIPVFGTVLSAIILKEGAQAASLQNLAALIFICVGIVIVNREALR